MLLSCRARLSLLLLLCPAAFTQFGTIKIDWTQGNGFATPTVDLAPHMVDPHVDTPAHVVDEIAQEEPAAAAAASPTVGALFAASIDSVRRLYVSLGGDGHGAVSLGGDGHGAEADDEEDERLREATFALVAKARTKVLRRLLAERGMQCKGCLEREDYVHALVQALEKPVVAAHAMPLFHFDAPLYPHTSRHMRFFEPRYKLMVERALLGDHSFGFVATDGLGTVAHIERWQLLDDGEALVVVRGGARFTVASQWAEACDGCDTGPLHHADVRFFNDTAEAEGEAAAAELVSTCTRLYHHLTSSEVRAALERAHGPQPPRGAGSYASSMWLAAACASYPPCAGEAGALLGLESTAERVRRIVAVQTRALRGGRAGAAEAAPARRGAAAALDGVVLRAGRGALGGGAHDQPAAWAGKLLLLHPDAARAGRTMLVSLLSHEPRASAALRGVDLLSPTGRSVRDATRPEYRADFAPSLDALPVFLGGGDDEAGCGFLALSSARAGAALAALPHSRGGLGGALRLTDLQLDYAPSGAGAALMQLKRALGAAAPPAVKMLMGCRAWELDELEAGLRVGLYRLVDAAEGGEALAEALVRAQGGAAEARALWEELWRRSEEATALEADGAEPEA